MSKELPPAMSKAQARIDEDIKKIREHQSTGSVDGHILNRIREYDEPDILPDLLEFLASHQAINVRMAVATSLCNYLDQADIALPALIKSAETDENIQVRENALHSIGKFWGKAIPFIPKLEKIKDSDENYTIRQLAASIIDLLNHPMIYPACPKCNQHSFAYHQIPSTKDIEFGLQEHRKPKIGDVETFAAIVYCLNCGHIIGPIGGKGYRPR